LGLTAQEVQRLANWGFELARHCSLDELMASEDAVEVDDVPQKGFLTPWTITLQLLSTLLLLPKAKSDEKFLNQQLFDAIQARLSSLTRVTPTLAWRLFRSVSSSHWVHPGGQGCELLKSLLHECVRDPGALTMAFPHAWRLGGTERERIFRRWLAEPSFFREGLDLRDFARALGKFMGSVAFVQDEGRPNNLRALADEFLASSNAGGMLANPDIYHKWCLGLAFGAKNQMRHSSMLKHAAIHESFSALMAAIWSNLSSRADKADRSDFVLYMLHPIQSPIEEEASSGLTSTILLWSHLEPIARRVASNGQEGDVFQLVFGIGRQGLVQTLGARRLMGVVDALHQRATSLGTQLQERSHSQGYDWLYAYEHAAEMLALMARAHDVTDEIRNHLHEVLQAWTSLRVPKASEAARMIRGMSL
jgi:hypothetical protein